MIPDDIRKAAEKVLDDIDGCDCDLCTNTVARALMAERKRAARVIEDNMLCEAPDGTEVLLPRSNAGNKVGLTYAAAIRRGDNPDA